MRHHQSHRIHFWHYIVTSLCLVHPPYQSGLCDEGAIPLWTKWCRRWFWEVTVLLREASLRRLSSAALPDLDPNSAIIVLHFSVCAEALHRNHLSIVTRVIIWVQTWESRSGRRWQSSTVMCASPLNLQESRHQRTWVSCTDKTHTKKTPWR